MNDRYNALACEAAAYARANAAEARVKDLEAEIEMQRRDQTEFIGAALCALGVNRDESVAPGNQILAEIERLRGQLAAKRQCVWTEDADGICETACGNAFVFNDGSPVEHDFKFCCYCGGEMIFKEFSETGGAA